MQINLSISEKNYQHIANLATLTKQSVDEILERALADSFKQEVEALRKNIEASSDNEVLTVAKLKMPSTRGRRLSFLLEKNSEGTLTASEGTELDEEIRFSQIADLRKAIAMAEAFKRGLINSVDDLS